MDAGVLRVDAIERGHLIGFPLAVRANREALSRDREPARTIAAAGAFAVLHAGNQHRQALHVAAVQREFNDAAILDHRAHRGVFCLQGHRIGDYLNRLRHTAYVELEILAHLRRRLQPQALDEPGLESWLFTSDHVVANREQRKCIVPRLIGGDT